MNLQTPRILWGALLSTTAIYGVLGFVVAPHDLVPNETMLFALMAASMGSILMSFVVPRRLLKPALQAKKFEVEEVPDPSDESMFRDMPRMIRRFVDPEKVRSQVVPAWQVSFILSLALSESVAIYGLVLAILGYPPMQWLAFVAVGAMLLAFRFPMESRILRQVETVYDARMS